MGARGPREGGRPRLERGPKEACPRGHLIAEVGRYASGTCRRCAKDRNLRRVRRVAVDGRTTKPTLPVAPALELMERRGLSIKQAALRLADARGVARGSAERMLARAKHTGRATPLFVDDLCAALGSHPYEVYGASWFEAWGD